MVFTLKYKVDKHEQTKFENTCSSEWFKEIGLYLQTYVWNVRRIGPWSRGLKIWSGRYIFGTGFQLKVAPDEDFEAATT